MYYCDCGQELFVWDDGDDWGYYCPECDGDPYGDDDDYYDYWD